MRAPFVALTGIVLLCLAHSAHAWECKFTAKRAGALDTAGVKRIVLRTGAGDLKVSGREGASRIEASGDACASSQALLDEIAISVRREGDTAYVETNLPVDKLKAQRGNAQAYLDLTVTIPANLPLDAQDSSGDAELVDLASLTMRDSSGDLRVSRVKGPAQIQDSSGEVHISDVASVRLEDSSGDVVIENIAGAVEIPYDSSGDLTLRDIGGAVDIRQDSSGDIRVRNVRGSVSVGVDSSGGIYAENVAGDFTVDADGSGDIGYENVKGRVRTPGQP